MSCGRLHVLLAKVYDEYKDAHLHNLVLPARAQQDRSTGPSPTCRLNRTLLNPSLPTCSCSSASAACSCSSASAACSCSSASADSAACSCSGASAACSWRACSPGGPCQGAGGPGGQAPTPQGKARCAAVLHGGTWEGVRQGLSQQQNSVFRWLTCTFWGLGHTFLRGRRLLLCAWQGV